MERKTKGSKSLITETPSQRILLEEYRALHSDYQRVRNEGVTRVNFFITSASVALGGVLVLGSSNTIPIVYFKLILILTLILLYVIGLEIYNYLVQRDIGTDRIIRGLARIRRYFIEIDASIEGYFINVTNDASTRYLALKSSGMRRTTQIIQGFFVGAGLAVLSTFLSLSPTINIGVGIGATLLTFLVLEINARRWLERANQNAANEVMISKNVAAKP